MTPSATPSSAWACAPLPTAIARAAVAWVLRKSSTLSLAVPRRPPSAKLFSPVARLYAPVAVLNWPPALLRTPSPIAAHSPLFGLSPLGNQQSPTSEARRVREQGGRKGY